MKVYFVYFNTFFASYCKTRNSRQRWCFEKSWSCSCFQRRVLELEEKILIIETFLNIILITIIFVYIKKRRVKKEKRRTVSGAVKLQIVAFNKDHKQIHILGVNRSQADFFGCKKT